MVRRSIGQAALTTLDLDVYGLRVRVAGDWDEVLADVRRALWWFVADGADGPSALEIEVERCAPRVGEHAALRASFVTPRNVVYASGAVTLVDYFGRALLALDRARGTARVEGEDPQVVREAVENLVLSRAGEYLNAIGLVRLHALGLVGTQGAVALTMPSGGGKSTLALQVLGDPRVQILSEDSPLLARDGRLWPFPLRIGVNPSDRALIPDALPVRVQERLEFGPKLAIDVEHVADRVARTPTPLRHLVIGQRTLADHGRLEPLPLRAAVGPLLREAVVGVGVYQGMEFVLQRGWRDVVAKSGTAARRAVVSGACVRRATVWRLLLGRDHRSNWDALSALVD